MTISVHIWPESLAPISSVFRAGGQSRQGGFTRGGARLQNPEPGGRATYDLQFAPFATEEANRLASWLVSRFTNGSFMKVPIWRSVQVISASNLDGSAYQNGVPWDNSGPWDNGYGWDYSPIAPVATGSSKGSTELSVDMSSYGQVIDLGHVVGVEVDGYEFSHIVMDVGYSGDTATLEISPPLRRSVTTSTSVKFRPYGIFQCVNPDEVAGLYHAGRHTQLNAAKLVEALI
jgi:hypothetical protein